MRWHAGSSKSRALAPAERIKECGIGRWSRSLEVACLQAGDEAAQQGRQALPLRILRRLCAAGGHYFPDEFRLGNELIGDSLINTVIPRV